MRTLFTRLFSYTRLYLSDVTENYGSLNMHQRERRFCAPAPADKTSSNRRGKERSFRETFNIRENFPSINNKDPTDIEGPRETEITSVDTKLFIKAPSLSWLQIIPRYLFNDTCNSGNLNIPRHSERVAPVAGWVRKATL